MKPLVFQSDFGYSDGAVSAMYGVAESVSSELRLYDLTHDIPQYNIWEASYRLIQTVIYWPAGTVFVSVVDPGVGSTRRSIAALTASGQIIVTPDNGALTHIKRMIGITEARTIDESINRLPGSGDSYTFHGRDIYAYSGARLAAGIIDFAEIGPLVEPDSIVMLEVTDPVLTGDTITGTIDVFDVRFGSLWTNIDYALFKKLGFTYGDRVEVEITNSSRVIYKNSMVFAKNFADVYVGELLVYVNSLSHMAVAINQGNFALAYNIGSGNGWVISLRRPTR